MIFFRPWLFKWPALISVGAVTSASLSYMLFVYNRRGHLLHLDRLKHLLASPNRQWRERELGIERIVSHDDV